jgi:hypothetical protein
VPTPSTENDSSPSPSAGPARDLRDSWWFRGAVLLVVLVLAGVVARGCGSAGRNVTSEQAIEIAKDFWKSDAEHAQVRFFQQGIPPQPVWAVSIWDEDAQGRKVDLRTVVVNATTGEIVPP